MVNQLLIWFSAVPILLGIFVWFYLNKQVRDAWVDGLCVAIGGTLLYAAMFFGSGAVATTDYELWNGQITSKERVHDTYTRSYDCNCTKNSDGVESCSTCYEDHYTVEWKCNSTVGEFQIEKKDSTSRIVYNSSDPAFWAAAQPGDPASVRKRYTNYVQAVPNSLFTPSSADLKAKFGGLLPTYPDNIYDFYNVDRFLTPGYSIPESKQWSKDISLMLRTLGPKKQVNLIVVVAKTDDPNYEYALRDHWEGANKNDVVIVIGSKNYPTIDFVRVLSWTKEELFKVELRDAIQGLGTVQREAVLGLAEANISKSFKRREMAEFEYLQAEIDPPGWLIALSTFLVFLIAGGTYGYAMGWFDGILRRMNHYRSDRRRNRWNR